MNDELKEILDRIETASEIFDCLLKPEECAELLDYITNLQQRIEGLEAENETLRSDFKNQVEYTNKIAEENERLKAQITGIEWEYQNTRCKYEKQYRKGITEEVIEDIETCFFNRENPSIIPIDSLDICHIFGYIDQLTNNWNELEEWLAREYIKTGYEEYYRLALKDLYDKMKEIKEGK